MSEHLPQSLVTRRNVIQWAIASAGAAAAIPLLSACSTGGPTAAKVGKTVVTLGTAVDVIQFDPYIQDTNSRLILRLLNSWLLNYDENLKPVPDALESYKISEDHLTVQLVLRNDVVFVTGKTMDSEDVVFALERAMDPKTGGNLAAPSQIIASVKADSKSEVTVTFKQPTNETLIVDLLVQQPILDKALNSQATLAKSPGGAGPYLLKEWRPGESLTLTANPKWYGGEIENKGIDIVVYTDTNAQVSALTSGAIDLGAYITPRDASRLKEKFDYIEGAPGAATMLLRISAKNAPFNDKNLRHALQHVIDRDRIVKDVLYGFGQAALLPWGPDSPAQDKSYNSSLSYDLDKAKEFLDLATAREGVAMVAGQDPVSLAIVQILQADLKKIGFDLSIEQVDAAAYQTRLVQGDFGIAMGQMGGGNLSVARAAQNSFFRSSNNPLWAGGNPPKGFVDAMNTLASAADAAEMKSAYKLLNDTVVEEAWVVGMYYVPQVFMFKKSLKGVSRDQQNAIVLTAAHVG